MMHTTRPMMTIMCLASKAVVVNTEQLRTQLDKLHLEAQHTRAKANQQRSRLLRLSESVENLHRQAVILVQSGKENDARELIFQKRRVMQALEKSKRRIEALDELAEKLTEAISVKESQLIADVAADPEFGAEVASTQVHIISPKQAVAEETEEERKEGSDVHKLCEDQGLTVRVESQPDSSLHKNPNILQRDPSKEIHPESDSIGLLREFSSYEDLMEHVDQQLCKIETELGTVINSSSSLLDDEERTKTFKLQQIIEFLNSIRTIRERIAAIVSGMVEIR